MSAPMELDAIVQAIVQAARPVRVILFGSHAKRRAGPESDLDICVIERDAFGPRRSRRAEIARIYRALARFPVPKDILVFSEEEARRGGIPVLDDILEEGTVLYEQ